MPADGVGGHFYFHNVPICHFERSREISPLLPSPLRVGVWVFHVILNAVKDPTG